MKEHCDRNGVTSHVSVPSTGSRELVERFKQKFLKEARVIASFENSHIVRVTDVFEENGTAYYVMDYLAGDSLASLVAKNGVIDEERALSYIRQVCDALVEVHSRNLLHLDIKPANIMLNNKGEAVLIDFGISKHYDESGNQTSSALVGISEGFAPLEQYEAGALNSFTPATDIYAVGATLYFMLTGMRPPKASDVMNEGLPALPKGVSSVLSNAVERAMGPRRKSRPQDVREFLRLLDGFEADKESDVETQIINNNVSDAGETTLNFNQETELAQVDNKPSSTPVCKDASSAKEIEKPIEKTPKKESSKAIVLVVLVFLASVAGCFVIGPYRPIVHLGLKFIAGTAAAFLVYKLVWKRFK